jgi:CDP-diglyceride synthetase
LYLLVFLPVLGAYLVQAPVLRYDLAPRLRKPIDGGRSLAGRRLFGDNKTWRGAIAMFAGTIVAALVLSRVDWYWSRLPGEIRSAGALPFGALLGLGVVAGELPNSFLKRRIGIAPGARRRSPVGIALAIFDQGDFVLGVWIALLPIWAMSPAQALLAFAVVSLAHLAISAIGYAIGARRSVL